MQTAHIMATKVRVPKCFPESAIGWWQDKNDDVGIRFHFGFNFERTQLSIRAFNSYDGEEMDVKDAKLQNDWIVFKTLCISTNFSAKHRWKFLPNMQATHELTLTEVWIKAPKRKYDRLLRSRAGKRSQAT